MFSKLLVTTDGSDCIPSPGRLRVMLLEAQAA